MSGTPLVVRGGWLITEGKVLYNGAAVVRGRHIAEVGSWTDISGRYPQARVYGSKEHILIPGLINGHHHSSGFPNSLHGIEDDHLESWLLSTQGMRAEEPYLGAAMSAGRLLAGGITSVVDMTVLDGPLEQGQKDTEARLAAYAEAGIRAAVAPGVIRKSFLISGDGEDERFLASLPQALRRRVKEQLTLQAQVTAEEYVGLIGALAERVEKGGRQQVWFGPPGPQWTEESLMRNISREGQRLGIRAQTHGLESMYEKLEGLRSHGKGTIEYLHELGVLSENMSVAHGVWVTEKEISLLAAGGTRLCHNPSSNLRLRAGSAPLNELLAAGVSVALGLDANGMDDDDDFFSEMRMALRLHRNPQLGTPAPSAADIFRMATVNGAKLMGAEKELGRIEPGYLADLVLLDARRLLGPWREESADPLSLVVTRAKARDVDSVLVDGSVVVRGGEPVGIDQGELRERLARQLRNTPAPDRIRGVIDELKPYLREWYGSWDRPHLNPYSAFNSRS